MITAFILFSAAVSSVTLERVPGQAEFGSIEIHGVAAGEFDPELWRSGEVSLLPDLRHPLLAPRLSGGYRNIYAPSAVRTSDGWRLFYGGWDGNESGHDWIFSVITADFVDFGARQTVIENGVFQHVCNVNALPLPGGGFEMMCTVYPDQYGRNKPAYFTSPDGVSWNGQMAPYLANYSDIISIENYSDYEDADINGMNVIFREGDALRLYFNDFRNFGQVFLAKSHDGKNFAYEGVALDYDLIVNDVKRFRLDEMDCWLMGLHRNREGIWYALSEDGDAFLSPQLLLTHAGSEDRYIVAVGWVIDENRLLGVLYGAGAVPELNRNRIFARWLQKQVVFTSNDGTVLIPEGAIGPDRQVIPIPEGVDPSGVLQVFGEDGETELSPLIEVRNAAATIFRVVEIDDQ